MLVTWNKTTLLLKCLYKLVAIFARHTYSSYVTDFCLKCCNLSCICMIQIIIFYQLLGWVEKCYAYLYIQKWSHYNVIPKSKIRRPWLIYDRFARDRTWSVQSINDSFWLLYGMVKVDTCAVSSKCLPPLFSNRCKRGCMICLLPCQWV